MYINILTDQYTARINSISNIITSPSQIWQEINAVPELFVGHLQNLLQLFDPNTHHFLILSTYWSTAVQFQIHRAEDGN